MGMLPLAGMLFSCASGAGRQQATTTVEDFECHERYAEYSVQGGIMSVGEGNEPEAGVIVTCVGDRGPRLEKWRLLDDGHSRKDSAHSMPAEDFEAFWDRIESTGWHNLSACENPEATDGDPVYQLLIRNDQAELSATCRGITLPFPFDRIRNELDLAAAGYDH